jgi:hypothetical protein
MRGDGERGPETRQIDSAQRHVAVPKQVPNRQSVRSPHKVPIGENSGPGRPTLRAGACSQSGTFCITMRLATLGSVVAQQPCPRSVVASRPNLAAPLWWRSTTLPGSNVLRGRRSAAHASPVAAASATDAAVSDPALRVEVDNSGDATKGAFLASRRPSLLQLTHTCFFSGCARHQQGRRPAHDDEHVQGA